MVNENLGLRCAHYLNVEKKSLRRDILTDQDKLCIVCRGTDSKYCDKYCSLKDFEEFKKLFHKENFYIIQ